MTVQQIILHMLSYIGVRNLDPGQNTITTHPGISSGGTGAYGDIQFALNKLNLAMQYVFREGPSSISERPGGGIVRPLSSVTVSLTQYDAAITMTGFQSWMTGCTIETPGDSICQWNELLSSTRLRFPYSGSTGSQTCNLYSDAIPLGSSVRSILPPIELLGFTEYAELTTDRERFDQFEPRDGYRNSGRPEALFVDAIYNPGVAPIKVLRIKPMPDRVYSLSWFEKLDPPQYTLADVIASQNEATGPFADPSTVLPVHWTESVLLPIATEFFLSHPSFSNSEAAKTIGKEAGVARTIMLPDEVVSRTRARSYSQNTIPCR